MFAPSAPLPTPNIERLVASRASASAATAFQQQRFRSALIDAVENEVALKKQEWENERQAQLVALRSQFAASLLAVGKAQKDAAISLSDELEGAKAHAPVWAALAEATVIRGIDAEKTEMLKRLDGSLNKDEGIFRSEVMKAAAIHERRDARRRASISSTSGKSVSSSSRYLSSIHQFHNDTFFENSAPPGGDGRYSISRVSGYREPNPRKPYNGPYAVDVAPHASIVLKSSNSQTIPLSQPSNIAHQISTTPDIHGALPRVPQGGPPDRASVVRVPTLLVRETSHLLATATKGGGVGKAAEDETPAAAAARELSARLLKDRKDKGRILADANKAARIRGVVAHKADRDVRDGLGLLEELHRLDSEARGDANLEAASNAVSGSRKINEIQSGERPSEEELEEAFLEAFADDDFVVINN
jgi:hypothetical protein